MHLVVGGSGQLGTALVRQSVMAGRPVRALVRPTSRYQHLLGTGAELAFGDLRDPTSVRVAIAGVDVVFASADAAVPRPGDSSARLAVGLRSLVAEAAREGVQRFVFPSVPVTSLDAQVPQFRAKRLTERALIASGVPYTIFRSAPYMECWLALPGSSIPLRGEENPTLGRPEPFLRRFRRMTGRMIEDKGRMLVIGSPGARNAFVSLHDVARLMRAVADDEQTRNQVLQIGGPEVLTWKDVAELYGHILGRPIQVRSTPPAVFHVLQRVMQPFAPAAANVMGLNRVSGSIETPWISSELADRLGVGSLRTVREFLTEKAALPQI